MSNPAEVLLSVNPNAGYGPDQITQGLTLGELLAAVEEAVELYGEDARVVTENGQRYGARYGFIHRDPIVPAGTCEFCGEPDCPGGEEC